MQNVREQYEEFKARAPNRGYGSTGYGGERGYGDGPERRGYDRGYNNDRGGHGSNYNNSSANSGYDSPAAGQSAAGASATDIAAYSAQMAQYYASTGQPDPYAAYGGYAGYVRKYTLCCTIML